MTTKRDFLKFIRFHCSECMGGPRMNQNKLPIPNPANVDTCPAVACGWFDFRMGKDPFPHPSHIRQGRKLAKTLKAGVEHLPK